MPFLLACSGGPDSLYLFYELVAFRRKEGICFHVAHVDHGWRKESEEEAETLAAIAKAQDVPFHLKKLSPAALSGNLEGACRKERYRFFQELMQKHPFQALLTAHHQDDLVETILKRLLEGAPGLRWNGISPETSMEGMRVLRPLLGMTKQKIMESLQSRALVFFEDATNKQTQFLRARMREELFPWLNERFGKNIKANILFAGQQMEEMNSYLRAHLAPLLQKGSEGSFGYLLDLAAEKPLHPVQVKFLLMEICQAKGFFLSRQILAEAADCLIEGKANRCFDMGQWRIYTDRQRLFILKRQPLLLRKEGQIKLGVGTFHFFEWKIEVSEAGATVDCFNSSWKAFWRGETVKIAVPKGEYSFGFSPLKGEKKLKKKGSEAGVPAFFYPLFPSLWSLERGTVDLFSGNPPSDRLEKKDWFIEIDLQRKKNLLD